MAACSGTVSYVTCKDKRRSRRPEFRPVVIPGGRGGSKAELALKDATKTLTRGTNMSVTSWFLVSSSGTRHRLPREMIFVGRDDCELMLQSRSVDKQHAVINYDPNTDEHMVKDLGSLNGTFVNDLRIPDQTYITLKLSDVIRFGYDILFLIMPIWICQHKVPEEALKHEKYTSQLQLNLKALEARAKEKQQLQSSQKSKDSVSGVKLLDRAERRAHSLTGDTDSPVSKPTPLYGQPSWWGEDEDSANIKQKRGGKDPEQEFTGLAKETSRYEVNGSLSDSQAKSIFSYRRESSYFQIPTKEFQQQPAKKPESQVHEIPTKDTADPSLCISSTPTPPAVQSHASFTIEFDNCAPGKMKIKDHVTKFSFRPQRKLPSTEVVSAPTEVMSAESKVADWLVQSNISMMKRRSQTEDTYSTKSDPCVQKINRANRHEDANHGDSVDPSINGDFFQTEPQNESQLSRPPPNAPLPNCLTPPNSEGALPFSSPESQSSSSLCKTDPHQTLAIDFIGDNPQKKRSQSFSKNNTQLDTLGHAAQLDKTRNTSNPSEDRVAPSPASSTPPTQRYTIPLKGPGSTGLHRAGSLRREKTEDQISTSFSSRSSSSASIRPFGSVGRRSKLAQEFAAEFLKQAKQASSAGIEKNTACPPATDKTRAVVVSQSDQHPASPSTSNAQALPQTSSPIHQPVPLKAPTIPLVPQSMEVNSSHGGPRNEEEDSLSDAGTYTIEADNLDKEVEEARNKIDQVFGVVESPESTSQTEAETSSAYRPIVIEGKEQHRQSSCEELNPAPGQGQSLVKAQSATAVLQEAPKWMSRWANLANSYTESGPSSGLRDISSQMELSGGGGKIPHKALPVRNCDSTGSEGSRARRLLPQVPPGEKNDAPTSSIYAHYDLHSTFDVEETSLVAPKSQDGLHLTTRDDVEPDSLSDGSKSDDGSIVERRRRLEKKLEDKPTLPTKSTSFYIGSEEAVSKSESRGSKPNSPKTERKSPRTFSTATLTKQRSSHDSGKVKPSVPAPVLRQGTQSPESNEGGVISLVRRESFTMDRPSNDRLPTISSQPGREHGPESFQGTCNQDTYSYLKETEDVLAVLEAKLQAGQPETTPPPILDSLSGESDVDTSSTVSQYSNKTRPNMLSEKPSNNGLHRERSSTSLVSQGSSHQSSTSEHLSEKCHTTVADSRSKTDIVRRPVGLRRSEKKCVSANLSDDPQSSSVAYSDQESSNHQTRKKYTVPLQKDDTKTSKGSQALSRANSMSAPRPTRASMLRRARLGEASDNEGAEVDRLSQEADSIPAKPPQESKKLSRLDILAMPRKRTGSFSTPSDTEASATAPLSTGRTTGFSNRSTESSGSSVRKASVPGPKPIPQKAALTKNLVTRGRSCSAKYASSTASSRRRQKGTDYSSTSDEEYESNLTTPKHKHSQTPSASHSSRSQPRPQPMVALRPKPCSRDSEEESHEGHAFQNWSTHSAEIARLSQDLAKDLAILAREIHDVAGDGDPQSSGVDSNASISTVTAQEELVQHIPDAGLNSRRVPPSSADTKKPEQNPADNEPNSRQQVQNREEVTVDNLMLNPVSQVIMAIKENTDQLAKKIKTLFQDKMEVWEEIEAKVDSDNDIPVIKTSNKDLTSMLKELMRVQKQLQVINTFMEPSEEPEAAARPSAPAVSSSSDIQSTKPPASRSWRSANAVTHRAGGLGPSESVRRAAVTSDDFRERYLV
ncbi:hypothetical protein LDENG_00158450 [Lucifuga dentata]|nr:hypothetical protein LDENG_00158450 [Lucifuga dentata]